MKLNSIIVAAALACGVLARPSDSRYYGRDLDFDEFGARELYDVYYPREFYEELYARMVSFRLCSMCMAHPLLPSPTAGPTDCAKNWINTIGKRLRKRVRNMTRNTTRNMTRHIMVAVDQY